MTCMINLKTVNKREKTEEQKNTKEQIELPVDLKITTMWCTYRPKSYHFVLVLPHKHNSKKFKIPPHVYL